MGLSVLSPNNLRKVNTQLGTEFVHASVFSDGHEGLGVGPDLNAYVFDRRDGSVEPYDGITEAEVVARQVVWALMGGRT